MANRFGAPSQLPPIQAAVLDDARQGWSPEACAPTASPLDVPRRLIFLSVSGRLGGAERVLIDMVALARRRHPAWDIEVLSLEDGPLRGAVEPLGAAFVVRPLPPSFAALGEYKRSPLSTALALTTVFPALLTYKRELARYLAARRADIVHANGVKAHVLAAWGPTGAARVVWHVHDYLSPRRVSSGLLRILKKRVSGVVANSQSVADDVRAVLGDRVPVQVVRNGIDANRFATDGPRLDLDAAAGLPPAPAGTVRVGLVATYAKWKGHDTFLRAMAALDPAVPVRGFIVGGPVYATGGSQWSREELEHRIAELGLSGRVGLIDFQTDTAPVYRALDIVVHASTEPEPFGLVIAEAMTCGRAVVVSGAGGAIEIGQPGRSLMTHRPGDAGDLARVMGLLAGDATLRACLGTTAAADSRTRLSLALMGERVDEVYAQVLS